MWADALLCLAVRGLARWTVDVVDRVDGQGYPIESVRFRWRRSAQTWTRYARGRLVPPGATVTYAVRPL